jgi:hypothetical protein
VISFNVRKLDTGGQGVTLNYDKNNNRKKNNNPAEDTKNTTTTESRYDLSEYIYYINVYLSSSIITTTTTNYNFDQDNHVENDEATQIPSPSPTSGELRQLQLENNQLYHDVAQRSEEIHAISSQVVEIAQLQNELFDNIFAQKELIQEVDTAAVASNDDLAAAIIHIRDAIRNTAQMRRWVIFFLLVMIFSLLFLDWYNV